jgi:glycosyltransferase involved in cell wall biosynthesis
MVDSVHTANWLDQVANQNLSILVFPSGPNRRIHPKILSLLSGPSSIKTFSICRTMARISLVVWVMDLVFGGRIRALILRQVIRTSKPKILHLIELQNAGYVGEISLRKVDSNVRPVLIVTNWGSDIYWFGRFVRHRRKIVRLLSIADYYICECERDLKLATDFGFVGTPLPVFPNAGVIVAQEPSSLPSTRKTILIKGYTGFVHRNLNTLKVIYGLSREVRSFRIVVLSASMRMRLFARVLARSSPELKVQIHRKGELSHQRVLELLAESRVYIGNSLSDGLSTMALEALSLGVFPIQTNTSCLSEFLSKGAVIGLFDPFDDDEMKEHLLRAIQDDSFVNSAQLRNREVLRQISVSPDREIRRNIYLDLVRKL